LFDARLRKLIDPPLNRIASLVVRSGVGANAITLAGAALVIPLFYALLAQNWLLALALLLANRVLDGLDGAVARLRGPTAWGAISTACAIISSTSPCPWALLLPHPPMSFRR